MYRILIVSEDFVLRKAVAFSLNDLDACVECADTVGAMYVLCTLHSVITRPEVEKFVGGMNPVQRRVLLRYIARQGYSANALQVFIPEEEKRYYVSLVDSYKLNVG